MGGWVWSISKAQIALWEGRGSMAHVAGAGAGAGRPFSGVPPRLWNAHPRERQLLLPFHPVSRRS